MFQIPNRKILTFRFFFFTTLSLTFLLSIFTSMALIFPSESENTDNQLEILGRYVIRDVFESNVISETINRFPDPITLFALILCVVVIGILLFIWVPSLSSFLPTIRTGRMVWRRVRFGIPERLFCLKIGSIQIKIRRNRKSLSGLLMRMFNLEVHFKEESPIIQRIADFTGMKMHNNAEGKPVLRKTVNLKILPLQLIRLQAILAVLMESNPISVNS